MPSKSALGAASLRCSASVFVAPSVPELAPDAEEMQGGPRRPASRVIHPDQGQVPELSLEV